MEKLIKLLNKYEKERKSWFTWRSIDSYDNCVYGVDCDWETEITMYSDLYSKYYGFIKWLFDEDKIDLTKLEDNSDWYWIELWDDCCEVLALLSIQDNPIKFLISILK